MFDYGDHCATSLAVQSCARLIGAPPRLSIGAVARQFGRCGLAPGRCACAPYASLNDGRKHYGACTVCVWVWCGLEYFGQRIR